MEVLSPLRANFLHYVLIYGTHLNKPLRIASRLIVRHALHDFYPRKSLLKCVQATRYHCGKFKLCCYGASYEPLRIFRHNIVQLVRNECRAICLLLLRNGKLCVWPVVDNTHALVSSGLHRYFPNSQVLSNSLGVLKLSIS